MNEKITRILSSDYSTFDDSELFELSREFHNLFVRQNFIGPLIPSDYQSQLTSFPAFFDELSCDYEYIYPKTEFPVLVYCSKKIIEEALKDKMTTDIKILYLSVLFTLQKLLENPSSSLFNNITTLISEIQQNITDFNQETRAKFYLQSGIIYNYYKKDVLAKEYFENARIERNFEFELSGRLGRRTKFQDFDVSQLVVTVSSSDTGENDKKDISEVKNIELNDDTILETIKLNEDETTDVHPLDQCILLAFCLNVKNTNPNHGLTIEEMRAYVTRVLSHANNWSVHTFALLLRSRLERGKSRTIERSVLQIQALVDQISLPEPGEDERLKYIDCIGIPTKWELEKELAEQYLSLGVIMTAKDIFERLEMWEDVIQCYQLIEKSGKAESILRELLEKDPNNPKFLCIMGDLRKDISFYEKAWEVSGNRYARAQRSLGSHYYKIGEFEKSIESYALALAINPLFENSWFIQGCAALQVQDYVIAENAFRRVVSINHENGEAWTNLSSVYIKTDRKLEAYRALKEALKCMYENGNVWSNFLWCCVDTGMFEDAIVAYKRVVELKKELDVECLEILVNAVIEDMKDADVNGAKRLEKKMKALLEFIATKVSNSDGYFKATAKFYSFFGSYKKSLDMSTKRYNLWINSANVEYEEEKFKKAGEAVMNLARAYIELGSKEEVNRMGETEVVCKDWMYQARMALRGFIGRMKSNWEGHEAYELAVEELASLKEMIAGR